VNIYACDKIHHRGDALHRSALIAFFSAVALLIHLLTNRYVIFRDELYYIACARHLDFGYVISRRCRSCFFD